MAAAPGGTGAGEGTRASKEGVRTAGMGCPPLRRRLMMHMAATKRLRSQLAWVGLSKSLRRAQQRQGQRQRERLPVPKTLKPRATCDHCGRRKRRGEEKSAHFIRSEPSRLSDCLPDFVVPLLHPPSPPPTAAFQGRTCRQTSSDAARLELAWIERRTPEHCGRSRRAGRCCGC